MPELVWIIDPVTGDLVVEGLEVEESLAFAGDLLPTPAELNCARPLAVAPIAMARIGDRPVLRVAAIWHGSVVEGPGRRSVVQFQGCPLRCSAQCFVRQTHSMRGGTLLSVADVVDVLLDPVGGPRDGVTVIGGEPMAQPVGLAALLRCLKARDIHTVVYTGFTLEALVRQRLAAVRDALAHTDLLIDGPYIPAFADGAGEWRGSCNQRLISKPGSTLVRRLARRSGPTLDPVMGALAAKSRT